MPKLPKVPKGWRSGAVHWHIQKRKRPIAYSSQATSDIITTLMGDLTIKELRERITYDEEAKAVLDEYIKHGFGDWVCKEHFDKWVMRHSHIPKSLCR